MSRFSCFTIGLVLWAGLMVGVSARAETLDFELSDQKIFVRLSDLPAQTTLINFWRWDCPPCAQEMPMLAELARQGKVRVVLVALHKPTESTKASALVREALKAPVFSLYAPSEPQGLLRRFGNPLGVLPHTVLVDSRRNVCARHTGLVSPDWLGQNLPRCT